MTRANFNPHRLPESGFIFYDAECAFCLSTRNRLEPILAGHPYQFVPRQDIQTLQTLGLTVDALEDEIKLLERDGTLYGGADAILQMARQIWWAWPLWFAGRLPLIHPCIQFVYRWIASRRNCIHGSCKIRRTNWIGAWLPLVVLPAVAFAFRGSLPAWMFMWLFAGSIFLGCKWLTYQFAVKGGNSIPAWKKIAYLIGWPGMDAGEFFKPTGSPDFSIKRFFIALGNMVLGGILIWFFAWHAKSEILAGWIGMVGIVLTLHFGGFALLACFWRACGIHVEPIMRAPILATSLGDFWGRRWNGAFNRLAFDHVFKPVVRRTNVGVATLAAFSVSGLVHELVISVPAAGGYGLPFAYFLFQGFAMLSERSRIGKQIGLARGFSGWLFTLICTAGPAFWLFHPVFVRAVILPFMKAISAL